MDFNTVIELARQEGAEVTYHERSGTTQIDGARWDRWFALRGRREPATLVIGRKGSTRKPRAQPWVDLNPRKQGFKHRAKAVAVEGQQNAAVRKWNLEDWNQIAKALGERHARQGDTIHKQFFGRRYIREGQPGFGVGDGHWEAVIHDVKIAPNANHAELKIDKVWIAHGIHHRGFNLDNLPRVPNSNVEKDSALRADLLAWKYNTDLGDARHSRMRFNPQLVENVLTQFRDIIQRDDSVRRDSALHNLGWRVIGEGYYSTVYANEEHPGMIVKYGKTGPRDAAYAYYHWALENQDKHGVPTVAAIRDIANWAGRRQYLMVTEKYEKVSKEEWRAGIEYMVGGRAGYGHNYGQRSLESSWPYARTLPEQAVAESWFNILQYNQQHYLGSPDLHRDNIMRHAKTGELIITDPLSE